LVKFLGVVLSKNLVAALSGDFGFPSNSLKNKSLVVLRCQKPTNCVKILETIFSAVYI